MENPERKRVVLNSVPRLNFAQCAEVRNAQSPRFGRLAVVLPPRMLTRFVDGVVLGGKW
jgi:hypothetical protein